ncbi:LysR family transcriptional regulator [Caldimonas sp. KR1-144]|uniref:LysR family transcriptional regulator n=1 Tax=Caldimonas sp. KR1-144 TaxID=3400911 RepID=UPI003C0EF91A
MTATTSSLANPNHQRFGGIALAQADAISDADLRLLRVFSVVVVAGGFSAATAELQTDLSAVSRQVKELEARVGARLCSRGRGGFALTPAGQQLFQSTQSLFAALKSFRADLRGLQQQAGIELRLGVVDALLTDPSMRLVRALGHGIDTLPGLRIHLAVLRPIEIERQLLAGELDAGILAAHMPAAGLERLRLHAEANSLYCAPGHPCFETPDDEIDPADVQRLNIVVDPYTVDLPLRGIESSAWQPTMRADSLEGVATLVRTGRCAGFLPDHYVEAVEPLSTLRRIRPEVFSYTQDIELTYRKGAANAAVDLLIERLGTQLAGMDRGDCGSSR